MKRWVVILCILIVAAAAAGGTAWWWFHRGDKSHAYRVVRVERGDVVQTVRATGTVQPVKLVQVGTQVNGPITKLYVDYNDVVKAGQLVALIDPTVYEARLAQDEANLKQALAGVEETQAKLTQAEKDLERSKELLRREMLSQSDLDAAVATRDSLAAQLKVAQAAVEQARATDRMSKANLDYTSIHSPVDGVVIARNVSEGQTVVASLSAQVLFMVATDLKHMQVEASVPEADIGKIRAGQPVSFTVDAYDQEFTGTVNEVRLAAATVQNVVTYPVVVSAANPELKLFPSMTADIACEVARATGVLKVPNAALRFKPATTNASERGSRSSGGDAARHKGAKGSKIWIQKQAGGPAVPVRVTFGITDGAFTEITRAEGLSEGDEVIVGIADTGSASGTVNPFTPQMPGRGQPRR